jgi:hypothetical protein
MTSDILPTLNQRLQRGVPGSTSQLATLDLLHELDHETSFQWFELFILAFAQEVY